MTTRPCRHSRSLSRTGNVLHSFRQSAFACLSFNKVEEVQHIIVIPSDSHSGINYPPTFVGPPFSPERSCVLQAFLCYIDRLEVCGEREDKEYFYKRAICNILLLSFIPT